MKPILLFSNQFRFNSVTKLGSFRWLFLVLLLSLQFQKASATHGFGGELTYQWLYGTTYQFTAVLYRDCSGIPADPSLTLHISGCGGLYTATVNMGQVAGTGQEITYPCPTSPTTCNGGSHVGIQKYVYRVTYDLGHYCTDWTFGWGTCCRANSITTLNGGTGQAIYLQATLNNVAAPTTSSPTFSNNPITFLCLGQTFTYNPGGTSASGDSLGYSLVNPLQYATTPVTFNASYSATQPILSSPAVTIDPLTGDMTMTPTNVEIGVCAMLIQDYQNGVLVGSVMRDMPIIVSTCNDSPPTLCGINGTGIFKDTVSCPGGGTNVCFSICSGDSTVSDTVTMTVDTSGISGATFSITGNYHPTGNFCWTATVADVRSQPYTFTVTARNNACPYDGVQTKTYYIWVLSSLNASVAVTNVLCNGNNNGTATVNASSSHPPITYLWNTGATTSSVSGLTAGTYTVTATDANGCTGAFAPVVTQPSLIQAILNPTNVPCNGGSGGSALIYIGGGTPPYHYLWNNGETTNPATNLSVGTYTVTVTDAHGCTNTFSESLTQPPALIASTSQNSACGANSGVASVTAGGGVGPYTYAWTNGASTSTISGLSAGIYKVIVSDSKGCTISELLNIASSPAINLSSSSLPNTSCSACNGSATITVSGGTANFSYVWNSGQTTSSVSGLCGGPYVVTVTDANSCQAITTVTITQPFSIRDTITHTDILCHGDVNGTASVTATGGTPPFTYLWSNGATTTSVDSLAGGTYTISLTDANGCQITGSVTITQPTALVLATTAIPSCSPNSGQATVSASGGTPGYGYSWSNGANTSSITLVPGGTYTVIVTDSRDCATSATVVVGAPPVLTITTPPPYCRGDSATLIAGGALSYTWSPSGTLSSSTGDTVVSHLINTGTYTVTGTGTGGCTATTAVTVTVHLLPTINILPGVTNICAGTSIALTASGAASYVWSPATGLSSTNTAIVISTPTASTSYTVTGTDANGCINTATKLVLVKTQPVFTLNNFGICHGNCIQTSLSYSNSNQILYSWSPPNGLSSTIGTSANLPNACPVATQTYTVIGNLNSCRDTQTVTISVGAYPGANITGSFTICNGQNASLCGIGNGANYSWTTGQLTSCISASSAGTYCVSITNNFPCTSTACQQVDTNTLPLNFPRQYYICETTPIQLNTSGGTSYSWAPPTGLSCTSCCCPIASIAGMTYTVTVSVGACSDTAIVHVDQAPFQPPPTITIVGGDTLVTNGYAPYQWFLNGNPITGATDSFYVALTGGVYSIQAADIYGCSQLSSATNIGINEIEAALGIRIYPNPAGDMFTIYGFPFKAGTKVKLYNAIGQVVYGSGYGIKFPSAEITVNVSSLSQGMYFVELISGEKIYRTKLIKQ